MSASEQSVNSPIAAVEAGVASSSSSVTSPFASPVVPLAEPTESNQDVDMNAPVEEPKKDVMININVKLTTAFLLESAQKDFAKKRNMYLIAVGDYLALSNKNPDSEDAKLAFIEQERLKKIMKDAENILESIKTMNSPPSSGQDDKKSTMVPVGLPFLQLTSDRVIKSNKESFDSAYDFCQEFEMVLEADSLSLDDSWERLLPMCLNKEERSWFEDKLKNRNYNWKTAEGILLDHIDTPFRKFLNMGRVWCMKQGKGESARTFGAKFQKARRQACLEDEVRESCLIPLSVNYGTKMPSKIEDVIALVSATTSDSTFLLENPGEAKAVAGWNSFAAGHGTPNLDKKGKKRAFVGEDTDKSKKSWNLSQAKKKKVCFGCRAPWSPGHSCPERERKIQEKVSHMAIRSGGEATHDDNTSALANMALD
ncbi:hypothetical protein A0J61_11001, partial [Choanephora cucurbitarum]